MSGQRHPDTQTLASLRAGLADGLRGRRLAEHVAHCARCSAVSDELAAVSAFLARTPDPPLPETFEQRISAALAAEAALRAGAARDPAAASTGPASTGPASTGPASTGPATARRRPARTGGRRFRLAMAFVPVAACLLAVFGYLLSTIGGTASTNSEAAAPSKPGQSAAAPAAGANGGRVAPSGPGPALDRPAAGFVVTATGTRYLAATLRSQVRGELARTGASVPPVPGAAPSGAGAGGSLPSAALIGCVLHLTGNVRPSLVDKATYQANPVYVIAVPDRAWVVGRDCTAAHPALITSVPLTAAP